MPGTGTDQFRAPQFVDMAGASVPQFQNPQFIE